MRAEARPTDTAVSLVSEFQARYPYEFDPFQADAMRALARGASVLVAAPTGTGKTVIAEFGVFLARKAGLRAIYTTPIKALSNQKYRDFKTVYGDETGLLTGDIVLNAGGSVLVMTTEVLRNMVVQREQKLDDLGLIVFDEVHYVGDKERGTAWEEAILLAPKGVPLVCLSATVPNADEVATWLRVARGELECIFHDERTVPLEHHYFLEGKAHLVMDAHGRRRKWFPSVGGELASRYRPALPGSEIEKGERDPLPELEPWQVLRHLEDEELTPSIYFLFSRRACERAAESCLALKTVEGGNELAREARARLADLPTEDRALRQVGLLLRLLPRGIAVHHAGLLPVIKMLVEDLFAAGRLRAVFATDTLALGINMPARTVVIGEMSKWDGEQHRLVLPNEYRQMTGRAGRRGIDVRGISLILYSPWVTFVRAMDVVQGELLPLESAFAPHYSTALNLWHRPEDRDLLADLYARSLRRFQHDARLEDLTREHERLQDDFELRSKRSAWDQEAWRIGRQLGEVEHELTLARRQAAYEARALVDGLGKVLERYGYLSIDRPARKAALLRYIFHTNALTLAELLATRALDGLRAEELAELASWFAYDREDRLRWLPLPHRMQRLHTNVLALNADIMAEERRFGLEISHPINEDFRGLALAWAEGRNLGEIAERARLAEGDLVGVLQKTLDLLGQLRSAAQHLPTKSVDLLSRLEQADAQLRRGVVEASYRWAISGPPEGDQAGESGLDVDWDATPFPERSEPRLPQRRAMPRGRGRGRGQRPQPRPQQELASSNERRSGHPSGTARVPGRRKARRPGRSGGPPRGRKGPRRGR
jgi:ATP-dependent RNA helicase HelY